MNHVSPAKLARIERRLSSHDRLVIENLDRVRLATTEQLHRLLAVTEPTTLRRSQAKLAKLRSLGAITRLDRNVGGVRAGSTGHVYALDTTGQRLASGCGPAGGRRRRRPWTPGLPFIAHQLTVTELYVRLREAEGDDLAVLDFDAEPLCWRTFTGVGGARAVLKPDAFLRLGFGSYQDTYFIEVDQATQSLPAINRKLVVYRRFYATGREQERYGAFPQVLFLAPSEERRAALADLIERQPDEIRRFAAVALQDDAPDLFTEGGP
ncbi:MAG: replication-relaxation family protein [Mycobacteriales bacterium]